MEITKEVNELIAASMTVKRRNQPEWMAYYAEKLNAALKSLGCDDRVEWPGKWAQEYHYISGGKKEGE